MTEITQTKGATEFDQDTENIIRMGFISATVEIKVEKLIKS